LAAGVVALQHHPVRVPQVAVVVRVAVAVFIEQRGVVEVRVSGDGESEDAAVVLEADQVGIERGRPDVGEHAAAGELAGFRGLAVAGPTGDVDVEGGDVAFGGDFRLHDVERSLYRHGRFAADAVVSQAERAGQHGGGGGEAPAGQGCGAGEPLRE